MDVASLSSLPIGVRWWRAPEPSLTVIVKATFSLAEDGKAPLAAKQEPLGADGVGPRGEVGDLRYASDFAPLKARADVLVVGHVWAAQPATALSAAFAVDHLERRFCAVASEPVTSLPLHARYLRSGPEPDARALRVGPGPSRAEQWAGYVGGAPCDFSQFNVAPPEQQLELLRSGARIRLEWLIRGAERRDVRLPGQRPKVFYVAAGAEQGDPPRARVVSLRCDTLWIDVEHAICTLTWRGVHVPDEPAADRGRGAYLAVVLQPEGLEHTWETVQPQLREARWVRAVEFGQPLVPPAWVRPAASAVELPAAQPLVGARSIDDEEDGRGTVATADAREILPPEAVLPFKRERAGAPLPAKLAHEEYVPERAGATEEIDLHAVVDSAMPFIQEEEPTTQGRSPAASDGDAEPASASPRGQGGAAEPTDVDAATERAAAPAPAGMRLGAATLGAPGARLEPAGLDEDADEEDETAVQKTEEVTRTGEQAAEPQARARAFGDTTLKSEEPRAPERESDQAQSGSAQAAASSAGREPATARRGEAEGPETEADTERRAPAPGAHAHGVAPESSTAPTRPAAYERFKRTAVIDPAAVLPRDPLPFTNALMNQVLRQVAGVSAPAPASRPKPSPHAGATVSVDDRAELGIALPPGFTRTAPSPRADTPPATPARVSVPTPAPLAAVAPSDPPARPPASPPPAAAVLPTPPPTASRPPATAAEGAEPSSPDAAPPSSVLSIETYAAVKAEMWAGGGSLAAVLAQRGLDEATWRANERRQEEALAQEAKEGASELATRLMQALVEARTQLADSSVAELSLDEYVTLRIALDVTAAPDGVLEARGLTAEQWQRVRRHWNQQALTDPAIAKQIRTKLAAARKQSDGSR